MSETKESRRDYVVTPSLFLQAFKEGFYYEEDACDNPSTEERVKALIAKAKKPLSPPLLYFFY